MKSCLYEMLAVALFLGVVLEGSAQRGPGKPATIVFKDGFTISGIVRQPGERIVDPSGASVSAAKAGAHIYLDDLVRQVLFSPSQLQEVLDEDVNRDKDLIKLTKVRPRPGDNSFAGMEIVSYGEWDTKWDRMLEASGVNGKSFSIPQRITLMTPKLLRVDTTGSPWSPMYYTREFSPEAIRTLVIKYYAAKKDLKESDRKLQVIRFLLQTASVGRIDNPSYHELAQKDLDEYVKEFPAFKSQVETYQDNLKKARAHLFLDNLLTAYKIGQHQEVQEALKDFGKYAGEATPDETLKIREIKNKYTTAAEKLKQAQVALKVLAGQASLTRRAEFIQAAGTISQALNIDSLERIQTFVEYAEQYDREAKQKRKHSHSADQVLALAVTGWLQGNEVAEPDVANASLLWKAGQMVLAYQKTDETAARQQVLESFLKEKNVIAADVLDQIIRNLPPPAPPEKTSSELMKLDIAIEGLAQGTTYYVQLPPGYHPYRSYPVLILLHGGGDTAENMLRRLSDLGARHGYILAAPVWAKGLRASYDYSPRQHAMVLDCLRDLRRRFQVNSDKVFLFGFRHGGTMAWDVGLSHPSQFAGVLTMCGTPQPYAQRYWPNGQYLNFYAVDSDGDGKNPQYHRKIFKEWIRNQYPAIYVEYVGRTSEWFSAELPAMFDWMNRKSRANPMRQLGLARAGGKGEEFKTMRETDNRFYWLSTEAVSPKHLASVEDLALNRAIIPASLQGTIATGNEVNVKKEVAIKAQVWNHINVRVSGVQNVSIWLGPKMIDFAKPVRIRVNSSQAGRDRIIPPSIPTLLEDFYLQGDRQRLVYAKVDVSLK